MSKTSMPESVKLRLWGKAAGRCQYNGCNKALWLDDLTKAEFNSAYIAHIVARSIHGPRGDKELSDKLKFDLDNLMLLCDTHHRLIDHGDEKGHPVERLIEMKVNHEKRVEFLTSVVSNKISTVLLYGANIGGRQNPLNQKEAHIAMVPEWYPEEKNAIEIRLQNSPLKENDPGFWEFEQSVLIEQFNSQVERLIKTGKINHLSIFGIAPQPLLILLGSLVSDLVPTEIYQLHREPTTWQWLDKTEENNYLIKKPRNINENIALVIALSGTVNDDRIYHVLGENTSIWKITIDRPFNDYLQCRSQLSEYRNLMRNLFDEMKAAHGQERVINVFPVMPVATAIELGRVWMPKADLPLKIYDENRDEGGFVSTLTIGKSS